MFKNELSSPLDYLQKYQPLEPMIHASEWKRAGPSPLQPYTLLEEECNLIQRSRMAMVMTMHGCWQPAQAQWAMLLLRTSADAVDCCNRAAVIACGTWDVQSHLEDHSTALLAGPAVQRSAY